MVGAPQEWKELPPDSAVLLVEFGAATDAELDELVGAGRARSSPRHETIRPIAFTREAEEIELAWRVREGLHGLIGRLRLPGTALIVEDVCVPPERIAEGARDLQALLGEHGFLPGVAGHASAGEPPLHADPGLRQAGGPRALRGLHGGLVELIVDKYDGSLKAEHGTGINMAPYVEREWGEKATELMWRVKQLADPDGVLSPGVVLNRDPGVHLRNLKTTPQIEESANDLRRVRLLRAGLPQPQPDHDAAPADRAAAGDGAPAGGLPGAAQACSRSSPTRRSTPAPPTAPASSPARSGSIPGQLVKELREERHTGRGEALAQRAARRWGAVEAASRVALRFAGAAGAAHEARAGRCRGTGSRAPAGDARTTPPPPSTSPPAPTASSAPSETGGPAAISRVGRGPGGSRRWSRSRRRAGLPVWIPADVAGSCCGLPWSSKGFGDGPPRKGK